MNDQTRDHAIEQASASVRAALGTRESQPLVKAFFDTTTYTVTYVVSDPATSKAAIIDSVLDYDAASGRISHASANAVIEYVGEQNLSVELLIETHVHADHLSAAPYLQSQLGGKIAIGEHISQIQSVFTGFFNPGPDFESNGSQFGLLLKDGDSIALGNLQIRALHVPGHTPADIALVIGDCAFIGDTMFMPDYGTARADFPGGDAGQLYQSIQRLLRLPDETRLFVCHDYKAPGRDEFAWETTVKAQREGNLHICGGTCEAEFVDMRNSRDATLNMPALMLPSVQVNMRAGHLPPAEDNGVRYLKIPIDQL